MAVMTVTRTLRKDGEDTGDGWFPGDTTGIDAPVGARVDVIGGPKNGFLQVRLFGAPGNPEGWVSVLAVDQTKDTLGPLDKLAFANICAWDAIIVRTSAHYIMAVAELRTDIVDGAVGATTNWGPFALSPAEWEAFRSKPELELDFTPEDIKDWLAQCMVFATMANASQARLAALLSDQPNATELYLAQLVGSKAASVASGAPGQQMDTILASVSAAELAVEAVDLALAKAREPDLLGGGKTAREVLDGLGAKIQKALDDTKQYIAQVGAEIIAAQSRLVSSGDVNLQINFDSGAIPSDRRPMAELISKRFGEKNYGSLQQIAAIANAIGESGLVAGAKAGGSEESYGLFQLNRVGGVGAGHTVAELKDPEMNIAIMLNHIATVEKSADTDFRAAQDILTAVSIFVRKFERPANPTKDIAIRTGIAQRLVV
ncbi:hypothetical protein LGH82_30990 [Mesorhizobium sp. PAMC28654]|uniref:phage tail tip lysozyme n=1 Tax=Mesorhizobium sp. PAMC28654 TaxID=2880934 RepID=UPI001D0B3A48|nr:phage tail tip lysozyme [Mesorhizobium sp. PAMC28654]UDL89435.1 hypothetical protein LGH82_30990 [Mesorhizobium sp. PAMC28654]